MSPASASFGPSPERAPDGHEGRAGARRGRSARRRLAHRRLHALARETGWDPGSADYIVGTSAGSMVGALVAAGVPPWFMVAHSRGESFDGPRRRGRPARRRGRPRRRRRVPAPSRAARRSGPGSLRMAATALLEPAPAHAAPAAWPAGCRAGSSPPTRSRTPSAASSRRLGRPPELLGRGLRLRDRQPRRPSAAPTPPTPTLADAVAASCAIPGFYRPVKIGGRRYVDGGVCSASNLDLLAGRGLDLVICLNPPSSLTRRSRSVNPLDCVQLAEPRRERAPARQRGEQGARVRDRGRADPADGGGPRADGTQPDEPRRAATT